MTTTTTTTFPRMDIYSPAVLSGSLSRSQERQELQQLNERFAAYVHRVRVLGEENNQVDSSAIVQSLRLMEGEMSNLKNMYEVELEKLRKELESCNHERTTHQVQANKQMQYAAELQDRLGVETDKTGKLQDEINNYQRRVSSLDMEIQSLRVAATRPNADMEQLQRNVGNLTRELEAWKHRYEHEQVARQEAEGRNQQLMQKAEFNEKVSAKRVAELNSRIEMSAATILSLEAKVRDLSKADVSVTDLLRQVRDTAETELKKYQIESEEQYNKNLTALKAQLDSDSRTVDNLETERSQLRGSVGELQARIRALEGQVASLEHQRQTLEEAVATERSRAAEGVRALERKLREVQEMLVSKMREVTSAREQSVPLKAEIEALKALLEEEEKRLRMTLATTNPTTTPMSISNTGAGELVSTSETTSAANTAFPNTTTTTTFVNNPSSALPLSALPPSTYPPLSGNMTYGEVSRPPYVPSPPLSVTYIPEALQFGPPTGTSIDPYFSYPQYTEELDPQLFGYSGFMPKYTSDNTPNLNRVTVEPSPPTTPRNAGPTRAKSAPAERQRNLNLVRSDLGQGHDYFDKMFHDLQQDTLYSQGRPKTSQAERGRPLSSTVHDYNVTTSSATGNVKIAEVHQEGKFIRLLNEGDQEVEFGGFLLQQNVGGHPVAVFRFPPRSKFAPQSHITVYSACNDRRLHRPPTDFVWKEQQKWGYGPECTTILCKPNGQAVAWTTAAHRFARDTFQDEQQQQRDADNEETKGEEKTPGEDVPDDDSFADGNPSRVEQPVGLRREKQQPPTLQTNGYTSGATPQAYQQPSHNAASKAGGGSQRKYVSGVSSHQHSVTRGTGKSAGIIQGPPSPFHSPLQQELQQLYYSSITTSNNNNTNSCNAGRQLKSAGPCVRFTA